MPEWADTTGIENPDPTRPQVRFQYRRLSVEGRAAAYRVSLHNSAWFGETPYLGRVELDRAPEGDAWFVYDGVLGELPDGVFFPTRADASMALLSEYLSDRTVRRELGITRRDVRRLSLGNLARLSGPALA
jgi:hypothetical protein